MGLMCHRHLGHAGGGEFTSHCGGVRLIFFMDDVMYILLGSVKELRGGFISLLFLVEEAPKCGRCVQMGMISCYTTQTCRGFRKMRR